MNNDEMIAKVNERLDGLDEAGRHPIAAIKIHRELFNSGLADAKQWYDANRASLHINHLAYASAAPLPADRQARAKLDTLVSLNKHAGVHFAVVDRRGRWHKVDISKVEAFAAGVRLPKPPRKKRKAKRVHKCYQCSTTDDVSLRENPYAAEINHDYTRHWMCGNCAHQSAQDI